MMTDGISSRFHVVRTPMAGDSSKIIDALRLELSNERAARERAEADLQSTSEMMAVLAHEIRTPIGAFMTLCELLRRSDLDEKQQQYVSTLQQSASGLLAILDDTLEATKNGEAALKTCESWFELPAFVEEFACQARLQASHNNLRFEYEIAPQRPQLVLADAGKLRQMLTNYLSNALKFTDSGSITLKVKVEDTDGEASLVRFEMHDTGIGIAACDKAALFQPYEQVVSSQDRNSDGIGLGLHIVQQLSSLMGGDCGVASIEGEGSVFWFTVPLRTSARALDDIPETALGNTSRAGANGHVLLVDDNELNGLIVGTYLNEFGLTHDVARSGAEALRLIRCTSYDLVFMDVMMPIQNGWETARKIRALGGSASRVPIIGLTARTDAQSLAKCLDAGMNDCLCKPIDAKKFYTLLDRYLSEKAGDPSLTQAV